MKDEDNSTERTGDGGGGAGGAVKKEDLATERRSCKLHDKTRRGGGLRGDGEVYRESGGVMRDPNTVRRERRRRCRNMLFY